MNAAYIPAISALAGSGIGALASFATTWLTQRHQDLTERLSKEASRRERMFGEYIDEASKAYIDALAHDHLDDPAKLVSLYAIMNKLRLFAMPETIAAAEAVLDRIVEIYDEPTAKPKQSAEERRAEDLLRNFTGVCRAELNR